MTNGDIPDHEQTFSNDDFEAHNFYSRHDGSPSRRPFAKRQLPKEDPKTNEELESEERIREEWNRLRADFSNSEKFAEDWLQLIQNIHEHHGSIAEFLRATNFTRSKLYRDRIRVMTVLKLLYREMLRRRRLR